MRVFAALLLVEAHYAATPLVMDFPDLERRGGRRSIPLRSHFDPWLAVLENHFADLFLAAHSHPDDIVHRRIHLRKSFESLSADHSAI